VAQRRKTTTLEVATVRSMIPGIATATTTKLTGGLTVWRPSLRPGQQHRLRSRSKRQMGLGPIMIGGSTWYSSSSLGQHKKPQTSRCFRCLPWSRCLRRAMWT
jgi:hypothetical protein